MSKISFIKSDDRKYNIERCLSLIKSEIMTGLRDAKRVVIKPNCVSDNEKLASTNVQALDAVLEFIQPYTNCQITIAEGVSDGKTLTAFKNYRYLSLQEKYDFAIIDLNEDDFETISLLGRKDKTWDAQIAKTILNSDYLISISPPKTHNAVVYSGAIKNVAIGSLLRQNGGLSSKIASRIGISRKNKISIREGYSALNENIKRIYKKTPLHLAILDGFEAMQGDCPTNGEMVPAHFAIASSDALAADWLATRVMGIDLKDVGYLCMLEEEEENKSDYFVIGDNWQKNIIKFKMHSDFEKMKNWR
jgi:uncharacterized protein (DUF362 family)